MKNKAKVIFHIDLNAFYASCAIIKEPYLKNKVFVVGGLISSTKGVISTASYKARAYGIKSGVSMQEALKIYPRLLVVPVDFDLYRKKSREFINLLLEYTDIVRQASIDEAYLDLTELSKTKHPLQIAKEIQTRLLKEFKLPCSIGIAPTLFLAKMASDYKKPLGITVIRKRDVQKKLYNLDVKEIYGIGAKTYPRLKDSNINTIADFMNTDNFDKISKIMKEDTYHSFRLDIQGESSNYVDPDKYSVPKSISSETTFNYDVYDSQVIFKEMINQLMDSVSRLKRYEMLSKTVGFKLKFNDFTVITRSVSLNEHSNDEIVFKDLLDTLFYEVYDGKAVRLVGASLSNLILKKDKKTPFNLFTYEKITSEM